MLSCIKKNVDFMLNSIKALDKLRELKAIKLPKRRHIFNSGVFFSIFKTMTTLESLNFDNLVLRSLPIDTVTDNYPRQVSGACFSRIQPTPVESPVTVAYSTEALALIDLPESEALRPEFPIYFSGNELLPGSEPAAHCYCGHQFGYFSGQLGDGAAIYLGEIVNKKGERWEIQLKGAGLTPYSRTADGRKVLRSSIREFLCSEAMHHLGIPTTRAAACVTSDSVVMRDIFYNGNPVYEKATIVTRIASTFIRFGSFEIFKTRDEFTGRTGPSVGRHDILTQLLDYTISTFYPEINEEFQDDELKKYQAFLEEIVKRTADVVAHWQAVGFCHGVLNTDNMSIVGLTIDYGPYGFMDTYNPDHICNASDDGGRYTYIKQPGICKWNLIKLAEAIQKKLPLELGMQEVEKFDDLFNQFYMERMRKKLGLLKREMPEDKDLIQKFFDTMESTGADFTNCFRGLNKLSMPDCADHEESFEQVHKYLLSQCCSLTELRALQTTPMDERQFQILMMLINAKPELLDELGKGTSIIERELQRREKIKQMKELTDETKQKRDSEEWNLWLNMYVSRLREEVEGDETADKLNEERIRVMNISNPRYVLRNYIAQNAISKAEDNDYSEVRRVLNLLRNPYTDLPESRTEEIEEPQTSTTYDEGASCSRICNYDSRPPEWSLKLRVT